MHPILPIVVWSLTASGVILLIIGIVKKWQKKQKGN